MLKKIRKIVLLIMLLVPFKTLAKPNIKIEYIDNIYSNRIIGEDIITGKFGYIYIDGHIAFCLDPLKIVGDDYTIDNNIINEYYTDEEQRKIQLIIHYGAATHINDPYYYMATQELIWRIANKGDFYYTSSDSVEDERIDIEFYKNQIMKRVEKHDLSPSFGNLTLTPKVYDKIILEDKNNVLDKYFISNYTKNDVYWSDNLLNIQIKDRQQDIISLTHSTRSGAYSNVYIGNGQTLITSKIDENQRIQIKIEPNGVSYFFRVIVKERNLGDVYGKVKFKIFDLENSQYLQNGREYETNSFGVYVSDFKIDPGTYKIVYTDVPEGYISSKTVNVFSLSDSYELNSTLKYDIISYVDVPIGQLNIRRSIEKYNGNYMLDNIEYKIYASSDIYNVKYQKIYSANELVETIKTIDGQAKVLLPLGDYYVVEQPNDLGIEPHYKEYISFKYDNSTTDFYFENLDIITKMPTLNVSLNVMKEEIDGSYTSYLTSKYGLFAGEDITYLNEIVFKKGEYITELNLNDIQKFNCNINIPYGVYEIRELNEDFNFYSNEPLLFKFDTDNDRFEFNIYKKLKRGNLHIKLISDDDIVRDLKFIYDKEYTYQINNELIIKDIKIGDYVVILENNYNVLIKENETTILEIEIINDILEESKDIIDDSTIANDKFEQLPDKEIDNNIDEDNNSPDSSLNENNKEIDINNDKQSSIVDDIINKEEVNNNEFNNINNQDSNLITENNNLLNRTDNNHNNNIEELPNGTNYLKRYCYIFEIFLIAGIIFKLYAKNN